MNVYILECGDMDSKRIVSVHSTRDGAIKAAYAHAEADCWIHAKLTESDWEEQDMTRFVKCWHTKNAEYIGVSHHEVQA